MKMKPVSSLPLLFLCFFSKIYIVSIKIGRKMIVDYIERAAENEFDGWKKVG